MKDLVKSYDKHQDISYNLNAMAAELKKMIADNVVQIKKNEKVIEKEQASEDVVVVETKEEAKYKSQLSSLMRLR